MVVNILENKENQRTLTELIKIKRNQLDPSGSAFALSLRGIKVFEIFKKADFRFKIEIVNFRSPITYKMERLSSGPHRVCFRSSLRGIKGSLSLN